MPFSGQLWYLTEGGGADTKIARVNDDGTTSTTIVDSFATNVSGLGVDTAAGFYFAVVNTSVNDHALLVRGSINSSAAPVVVVDFSDEIVVETIEVDAINHKIYVGHQDGTGVSATNTGIRVYSYDPATGAVTDNGFLTTAFSDNRADESGIPALDPRDFAIDRTIVPGGRMYYTETLGGVAVGLFRLDLATPNTATALVSDSQFANNYSDGVMVDVEVDESTDLVYFTTRSRNPSPSINYEAVENALWYISGSATNGTAVKVTLTGLSTSTFYPGDMTFDASTRQIYIESEEAENSGTDTDDVIYVFQLDTAGTSASLIRTIDPGTTVAGGTIEGMVFTDLAALTVTGSGGAATEQSASNTALLSGAPTIVDNNGGYLTGATIQITGGTFSSNENSTADDHLGFTGRQITGTIPGTSITISWSAATETLTLSGYDTIAHYQTALAGLIYWATGDNPTNYGANTSRTITWTINDGTPGVTAGSVNSGTTTINITAANDAPVNGTVSSATGNENADIAITGLQVSDVDANPASATVTVTLSVTKGILTLRTNVSSGLTAGNLSGNGTGTVTITGTINAINTTLAASNGLLFHGNTNISGTDTLTVVTSDGGSTGTGGALSDTDNYTITIIGVNDAPTIAGDGTETLPAAVNEDLSPTTLANTISSLFSGQYTDSDGDAFAGVAVIANGSAAGTGQWQYWNGSTWVNIGAASTAAAVQLSASTAVRFAPATDFNGTAPTLTVRLVDASNGGITNGSVVNTTTNGGSTVYSTGTVVLGHTVNAVNDAPVVINGSAVSLTSVAEDAAPAAGQSISTLFSSHFSDAKDTVSGGSSANGFAGVAVTGNAATAAQGVYQYFDGVTWQDLPAVSTSSAFVLDTTALVRFVPAADYNGTAPSLTLSLIDDSAGSVTTGATPDLTTVGGTTQYSASLTLNVVVTATNDAPVASGSATLTSVPEDTANPGGATVSSLFGGNFSDIDGNSLAGVAISLSNATGAEGVWQYHNGASWVTIGSPSESNALVLAAGASLRFLPEANYNGPAPTLEAYLIDNSGGAVTTGALVNVTSNGGQTRYSDDTVTLSTSITAVNDAPAVPASATTVGATEQTAATLLGSLVVSDIELDARNGGNGDYAGASFTVQRGTPNAADTFAFDTSGASFSISGANIQVGGLTVATFSVASGVLTISFTSSGATATTALVNEIIEHVTYTNTSDAPPASVSLNYSLNDGGGQGTGGALASGGSVTVNITAQNDAHTGGAAITGSPAEDQVLTAVSTIADPDGLGPLHYQWQHDVGGGYVNVGADQATYTLGDGDIGGLVRVVIYYTDGGGTVESAVSAPTAAVTATNDAPSGGVSITGTTTEDQVLTADTSTLADSDGLGTLHYDWQRDTGSGFVSISGAADQATYTLDDADVSYPIRVVVSYTDGQGFANSVTSPDTAAIAGVNDPHTGGASITGTPTENQTLTAVSTLADIDGIGALHYDWQRDTGGGFVSTGAADQATYTLGDADVGGLVRVVISYTDVQGFTESATSGGTAAIAGVNDAHTGSASITGTPTEDQVLTAVSTLADADGLGTLHYDWQRDTGSGFVSIAAPDQATYTLGDADVGHSVRVVISYTDGQGFAESAASAGTSAIVAVNDPHTGGASITGTPTEDQVLTAVSTLVDIDGLGTLHYDWQRDTGGGFVSIAAPDQATYTLGDADVGGLVRVVISYTDGQGFTESATSASTAAIANVNDAPTGGVSITGTTTEDQVLTADTSALVDIDGLGTLHYDWQRDTGSGFVSIGAADQATYTLGDADVGGLVRVVVSYTDGQTTAEAVTSTATAAIAGVDDAPTGGASITGTTTEDQVLTADTSTLVDVDGLGTLHYDWQRDTGSGFVSISAPDQATYTLGDADVGKTIRVVVSYTDGQGFSNSVTSGATSAIAAVDDPHAGGVSVTGTPTEDQILTADTSTLTDNDGVGTLHYDWQRDTGLGFVSIAAPDQATYTLTDADVGGLVRVVVSYTDDQGFAESLTSASTAAIAGVNDAPTGGASITGTTTEDQVLTADISTLTDVDGLGTAHYDWQRDTGSGFVSIAAPDQATYTLVDADVGKTIRVVVSYTDGQGFSNSVTSGATAAIAAVDDPHTGGVSVTGTPTEDQVLTAVSTLTDLDGLGTLHYDWQRDTGSGFVSTGEPDQATYTLTDADVGGLVRVVVSYTDGQGFSESSTSASTASIAGVNDAPSGGASITGVTTENQVVTADTSTLVDIDGLGTLHYDWQRNSGSGFVSIAAPDQATYTLVDADVGKTIRVVVSYTDGQGFANSVTSGASATIAGVDDPHTGGVSITGTPTEDQTLTAASTLADVDGLGTFSYQWQRDTGSGFVNVGSNQATYALGDADVGALIRVTVSYTDGQGFAESATSAATAAIANVNDPHTGGVSISGTANVGQVLTAGSTLVDVDGLGTLHYQWQRDTGSGFISVGTDQSTYTLTNADLGGVVRVVTSYTDGHGTAESATSAASATVLPPNGPHTGGVSITGTVTEDQVLTANTSALADPAGLGAFHYQWQRSTIGGGYVNVGTDQATYTLGDADVGAQIRVTVSFTDGQGVLETETSGPTSAVVNVNDAPTGTVTISGTVAENQVLTAVSTLADADGLGPLHYQWQRNSGSGFVNVGTDQSTYTLGDADVGATIRVVTTYTDQKATPESKTSAATAAVANVNDAPTAANDANAVVQRLTVTGSVRANDGDIDNALTALQVTNVAYNVTHVNQNVVAAGTVVNGAHGKLTIKPDGAYSYVADHEGLIVGQVVTDKFDYTIKDPSGASATAQLTITVTGSATGDANANILISDASGHTLTGKGGADTLTGNGGADVFAYEAVSDSTIAAFDTITDFTHGADTLRLTPLITGSTKLTLNTDGTNKTLLIDQNGNGTAEGQIKLLGQGLQISDIVTGVANFGFTLNGSSGGDMLTGGSGADTINGSGGADTIRGGGGGDILTGGAGVDTFVYGDGDSPILHWDVITDFQTGQDKLNISAADDGIVILARFGASTFIYFGALGNSSVVQVFGDIRTSDLIVSGHVTFSMYGDDGNGGDDGRTSDSLTGGDSDDVLVGGTNDSVLNGGDGADLMYGGEARDTFQYTSVSNSNFSAYDSVIDFDSGQDKIDISAIDGGKVTIAHFGGTTFIYSAPDSGGNFQSVITVSGTALKATDVIASGGATQAFTMVGDGTSTNIGDILVAGAGNDILYGMDGNDTLTGAGGADFMLGGAGADTFVYTAPADSAPFAQDLIFDFSHAEADKLDLTGIDAISSTGANDAFSVVTSFSSVAGQLVIAAPDASGYYHVSGDVNGDGVADFVIALKVTGTLTSADILL